MSASFDPLLPGAPDAEPEPRPQAVGFLFAMPVEAKPLVKRLGLRKEPGTDGLRRFVGALDSTPVVAVVSGMGTELAARATTQLLDDPEHDITRVVVVGITGGVEDETPIGTLIRPEIVIDSASLIELRPAQIGEDLPLPRGALWTTDAMTSPQEVAELHERGIVGLDMETAAVGRVCDERGVPWSVFRVISDQPGDEVDDEVFGLSNLDGTPNLGNIASYVLRHPNRVPRLAKMGQNVKLATEKAVEVAVAAVASLSAE